MNVKTFSDLAFRSMVSKISCFFDVSIGRWPVMVSNSLDRLSSESTVDTISGGILFVIAM
jgi:hypothetical protein